MTGLGDDEASRYDRVCNAVDVGARFPALPFREASGELVLFEWSDFVSGSFASVLSTLVERNGDSAVVVCPIDPTPDYYLDAYGTSNVVAIDSAEVGAEYWSAISDEPGHDPTGALVHTARVLAVVGTSGCWEVFGDWQWELAVVRGADLDGLGAPGAKAVSLESAWAWLGENLLGREAEVEQFISAVAAWNAPRA